MMKWGRKKSSSSLMNPHLISHGFPKSWFSMFKKTSDSTKPIMEITKGEEKKNSFSPNRALRASWTEGQYHGEADDSNRRLSFGDERCDCQYLKSVRYDPDDGYEVHSLSPRCSRHRGMALERRQFAGRRQISELPQHVEILQENFKCQEGNESDMSKILGRRAAKDVKPRKMHQRTRDEKHSELPRKLHAAVENSLKAIEKDIFEFKPMRIIQTEKDYQKSAALQSCKQRRSPTTNSKFRTIQEGGAFGTQNLEQLNAVSNKELLISEWQNLKDKKIKEILLKSKEQKKNVLVCRESPSKRKKQVRKVRVYTPRTAARIECKIRAIEDLKKAKMKTNKVRKQRPVKEGISFDSFAVVKSSIDPQEDFKISMAEMITAIGIRQPQDLEELLACYLTLNCDEYHDLIIKVFRQVWFELNHVHFVQAMQTKYGCNGNNQLS